MDPIAFPLTHPTAFWTGAVVVTLYHATRSIFNQRRWRADENKQRKSAGLDQWTMAEEIYVHRVHDFLFHVICAMGGFVAMYGFARVFAGISCLGEIGAGAAILMSFLALVALAGVSGVLPQILLYGKLLSRP